MSTAPETTNERRVATSTRLLPLSKDPLQAPTDRDMLPSERREFVRTHRTCVFGYGRRSDGPAMSIVYYVPDDNDDLLVATMAERAKAKAVARNGKVSLCVLDETWPFAYLQVYCDAVIDDDEETLIDVMMAVAERMSGEPVPAELRPAVKAVAEQEGRVLVRCRPYATFVTPPRHLHSNDQQELTHWVSGSMPWDAPRHAGEVMTDVTQKWRSQRVTAALYDAGVKHDNVARIGAWAMWGTDLRPMFTDIARLADVPAGASVLDIPCGGGLAFRGLRTGQVVHYVAADISPYMLQRARREAGRRRVQDAIEFVEADVTALQFADASFDLCVTYNGLHCLPDPRAALVELVRVLRPGGTLRGTSCVTGRGPRQDAIIAMSRRAGVFGNAPHAGQIEKWLKELGLDVVTLERSGAVEFFEARLPFRKQAD